MDPFSRSDKEFTVTVLGDQHQGFGWDLRKAENKSKQEKAAIEDRERLYITQKGMVAGVLMTSRLDSIVATVATDLTASEQATSLLAWGTTKAMGANTYIRTE